MVVVQKMVNEWRHETLGSVLAFAGKRRVPFGVAWRRSLSGMRVTRHSLTFRCNPATFTLWYHHVQLLIAMDNLQMIELNEQTF